MRSLLAVILVAVVSVTAGAPSATAKTVGGRDARGDVMHQDDLESLPTPSTRPTVDITRYRIGYSDDRVSVVVRYADLRRTGAHFEAQLELRYDVPRGRGTLYQYALVRVVATPRQRGGHTEVESRSPVMTRCAVEHRIDYRRDTVSIAFPSSCLRRSPSLTARLGTYVSDRDRRRADFDSAPADGGEILVRRG